MPMSAAYRLPIFSDSPMQVYVETHRYDGGFKSCLIPCRKRPDILPAPDQVGLKSTEAELADGDYVLELACFQQGAHPIYWLGCYTHGIDSKHGDRGTYCGVGVWLVDAVLIHSLHLVRLLRDATTRLARNTLETPEIHAKLDAFASDFFDLGWCIPSREMPIERSTGIGASASSGGLSYLMLAGNQKDSFDLAGIDILNQLIVTPKTSRTDRRLYFLTRKSKVFVRQTERLAFGNAAAYAEHVICSVEAGVAAIKARGGKRMQGIEEIAV